MKKLILIFGIAAASFVLVNIYHGSISVNSVVNVMAVEEQDTRINEKLPRFKINGDERVLAILLSNDESKKEQREQILKELSLNQRVDLIVVVGRNHLRRGLFDIAFTEMSALIGEAPDEDFGKSERAFWEEEVLSPIQATLEEAFPEADIYGILIKEFADNGDVELLASKLADNLDENSLLIVVDDFAENIDLRVAEFQNEMTRNVLMNMDTSAVDELNVDSRQAIRFLLNYLEDALAQKTELDADSMFAKFYLGEAEKDRDLTIMAFGDIMLGRYVRTLMNENGLDYPFWDIQGENMRFFSGADVIFANLEGPILGEGKWGGTAMNFAFNRDIGPLLRRYNFNVLSIANNHAFDQGQEGRDETIEVLEENDIGWCGHSTDIDPESVHYGEVGDHSYAFICFDDVKGPIDDAAAVNLIKEVRSNVDYLLVSVHWGIEYNHSPDRGLQTDPAHAFIDAGADFVIGHHPHVVQTFEVYNGKLIFYSLGNFIFDQYWSQKTQEELAIGIVLNDDDDGSGLKSKVYLFPMRSEASQPYLLTGGEKAKYLEKFIGYGDYSETMKEMIRNGIVEIKN